MPLPRIAPLDPPYAPDVSEELAAMMPPGVPPIALFRTLARNPRVLRKIRSANLLDRGSLDRRDRELVILRTCARCGAGYEWGVHAAVFAPRVGISEAELRATAARDIEPGAWSAKDRALLGLADALHDGADVDDATYAELAVHFREEQIVELLVLAGFYHTISFVVNALRIPAEPGAIALPTLA